MIELSNNYEVYYHNVYDSIDQWSHSPIPEQYTLSSLSKGTEGKVGPLK